MISFDKRMRTFLVTSIALGLAVLGAGCGLFNGNSSTSPSSTTPTEIFTGTLLAQGQSLYTFTVTATGTVGVDLTSIGPSSVPVGLGLGTPSGTTCLLASSNPTATAGSTAQITVTENPGMYCVEIYDTGKVTGSATFSITISHT
jgi:hypothetical protein